MNNKVDILDFVTNRMSCLNDDNKVNRYRLTEEYVDNNGKSFFLKAVRSFESKRVFNECLALVQLSKYNNSIFNTPKVKNTIIEKNNSILITDFITKDNTSVIEVDFIIDILILLEQITEEVNLVYFQKFVTQDSFINSFTSSFCRDKAKSLFQNDNEIKQYLKNSNEKQSLCHGDLRLDHFMVSKDKNFGGSKIFVVDWEHSHYGNPQKDYASLIISEGIENSLIKGKEIHPWEGKIFNKLIQIGKCRESELKLETKILLLRKIDYLMKYQLTKEQSIE